MSDAMTSPTPAARHQPIGEKPWPRRFVQLVESGDLDMVARVPSGQRAIGTWGVEYLWDQADGHLTLAIHVHRGRALGSLLMFDGQRYVCSVRASDLPSHVNAALLAAVLRSVENSRHLLQQRQWDEDFLGLDITEH